MLQKFRRLFTPPSDGDEETGRIAQLGHQILLACIVLSPVIWFLGWWRQPNLQSLAFVFVFEAVLVFAYWGLRRGWIVLANCVFVVGLAGVLVISAFLYGGGISSASFGTYFVVVVYASILLGRRAGLLAAGFGVLSGGLMVYLENEGLLPSAGAQSSVSARLTYFSAGLFLVAYATYVSAQSLQQAVVRARQELAERQQAEATARKQLSIIANSIDGIALLDKQSRYAYVNGAYATLYGYASPAELIGQDWFAHYSPETRTIFTATIYPALAEQGAWRGELVGQRHDDALFEQEVSLVCLAPGEYAAIVRDITERKQGEDALLRTQKLESLGRLAGGIAHDFNNLLAGVLGQTSLAKAKLAPDSLAIRHLDRALAATTRGAQLTRQLLTYAGKGKVEAARFDLNELIGDTEALIASLLPKQVQLVMELHDRLPLVEGDSSQIQQAMLNLLLNAAEATDEAGKQVILRTEPWLVEDGAELRTIGGQELTPGCYVRILVIDQGVGIDKPLLQRMFDPFFSTKGYGRGLGLSASLGIIRQHKGGMTVESQTGVGSTFAVFLPEAQPLPVVLSTPASATQAVLRSGAVLVVDDEPDIRDVVAEVLQMQGVHVFTAQNGREGVESFQVHQALIEVIIMDMQMPVMNGAEATRQLLALKPSAHVIITSGFSEENLATAVTAHPSVIFLQKPYPMEKLVEMVRHRLQVGQNQGNGVDR